MLSDLIVAEKNAAAAEILELSRKDILIQEEHTDNDIFLF
jgi:hypothetical protein